MIKVVKFGGSSLADAHQFKKAKAIITADSSRRFVVPSAPGKRVDDDIKMTDLLYAYYDTVASGQDGDALCSVIRKRFYSIARELNLPLNLDAEFDRIVLDFHQGAGRDYAASRGEYLNGLLMAAYLDIPFVDAAEVICFDADGSFLPEQTNTALQLRLQGLEQAVIPGFYGSMPDGTIKTFSRGGSDITGSLVARAVNADLYENWTDVSGFLLADPRIVENPMPISTITYQELHELAAMGASVLHEDAVFPVKDAGIPINIKNTNRPNDPGTMIVHSTSQQPSYNITGIAGKKGFCAVSIRRSACSGHHPDRRVLEILKGSKIPFESVCAGSDTIFVLMDQKEFRKKEQSIIAKLHDFVQPDCISMESDLALVAVGNRADEHGISGHVMSALECANINVKPVEPRRASPTVLVGVRNEDFESAVRAIYNQFIKPNYQKEAVAFPV